jgi:hypothetical protein
MLDPNDENKPLWTDRMVRVHKPGRGGPELVPASSMLSPLWDARPLESDSWGNILGFDDGLGGGDFIDMRLWLRVTPDVTNEPPIYRPAPAPLSPFFKSGGVRRCYRPTDEDTAAVRALYPSHPNPHAPPWQRIEAELIVAGYDRDKLVDLNPAALLGLLRKAREQRGDADNAANVGKVKGGRPKVTDAEAKKDDEPDERGYVGLPIDPAAYAPAADILAKHTPADLPISMKELRTILEDYDTNRVRWTRPLAKNGQPVPNRRSVHLGDWVAYLKRRTNPESDGFPRLSATELERRKAAVRDARHAGK